MSETPPAGWYPDPQDADRQRYWDGNAWTEHTADASPQAASAGSTSTGAAATATGGATTASSSWSPDTWTWQSIVATIFCCNVLGVVGVLNAGRAESAVKAGDVAAANKYAQSAKKWTLWSAGIWLLLIVLYVGFIVVVMGASGFSDFQNY